LNPVQITNFHRHSGTSRWSPDGRTIVFDSRESVSPALYLVDARERSPRKLSTNIACHVPSWSRDGRWIYCTAIEAGVQTGIYKVPVQGGTAALLTHTPGYNVQEAKDRSLYFASTAWLGQIHVIPKGTAKEIPVLGTPTVLDPTDWVLVEDGIYFLDRNGPKASLKFLSFATAKVRLVMTLAKEPYDWGGLALSPDQRWLVYSQIDEKVSDIMLAERFN
jgi:Tol biopolymer transport system component